MLHQTLGDLPSTRSASAYELQCNLSIVTAHIGRPTGRSTPPQLIIDALHTITPNLGYVCPNQA